MNELNDSIKVTALLDETSDNDVIMGFSLSGTASSDDYSTSIQRLLHRYICNRHYVTKKKHKIV